MNIQEAFLYNWYDSKLDMNYVGYHKGSIDDGYICDGCYRKDMGRDVRVNHMFEEYSKRSEDFSRDILVYGTTKQCRYWEEQILTFFDAARNPRWYNKHNGGTKFICPKGRVVSKSTRKKLSVYNKGRTPWNKGKHFDDSTRAKMSDSHIGKPSWNKGIPHSEKHKENLKKARQGRIFSEETKNKMRISQQIRRARETIA